MQLGRRSMPSPVCSPRAKVAAAAMLPPMGRYPPGAQESRIEFDSSAGHGLCGLLVDVHDSQDVVILCHGYTSNKNGFRMPLIARELASKQIGSLRFDFSGNGESGGDFAFAGYQQEVSDLRSAVQYVRGTLNKRVAAILGHSKGGNCVLLYSAEYDDIPLVVNVAGRFQMKRGITERFGEVTINEVLEGGQVELLSRTDERGKKFILTKAALEERMNLDMEEVCKKITRSKVLTVHGTDDTTIPVEDAHSISGCIPGSMIHLVEGANHNFTDTVLAEATVDKIVDFIQTWQ